MKKSFLLPGLVLLGTAALAAFMPQPKWITLFDGKTISGWHSYHQTGVVGWVIEDGTLTSDGSGGDLVSDKEYENFDLEFDFKLPKGSNSGVIYKVLDRPDIASTYMSGPEYQLIDDRGYEWFDKAGNRLQLAKTQLTGADYDMYEPTDLNQIKPIGEWNKGRIVVNNNHVAHYLNGKKVVAYEYGSDDWKAHLAKSKFANWPYATPHAKGNIAFQCHSPKEKVWYRNIRIKEL
ncbi:3-keto-disaccharide hydrolase [Fibrella arboris]|uniref:3-keto-disaccharide hydrolase n=1 Tax=Fibrella arboris TaxID=3242486 RepID=UPI003520E97B